MCSAQIENPVLVAGHWRHNHHLFQDASHLYMPETGRILDATYGKGNWWNQTTRSLYLHRLTTNDRHTEAHHSYDYRQFPTDWADRFTAIAFDPPYIVKGSREGHGLGEMNASYGLEQAETSYAKLLEYNIQGLAETWRILEPQGFLFLKYANQVISKRGNWGTYDMRNAALDLGYRHVADFVYYTKTARSQRGVQRNPHNNISTLLVFRKPGRRHK